MIVAVDFDGCLCENRWPDIGKVNQPVINELVRRQTEGDRLILWTCREGLMLDAAIMWCLNHGLRFDAINDNLPENIDRYGNNCRKVYADEYWDDKSVIVRAGEIPLIFSRESVKRWERVWLTVDRERLWARVKRWWHKKWRSE